MGVLKRHSHSFKNNKKLFLGIPLKFTHMPLGLIPESFNPIDSAVFKLWYIQYIISLLTVRIGDAIGNYFAFNDIGINVLPDASGMILVYTDHPALTPQIQGLFHQHLVLGYPYAFPQSNSHQPRSLLWRPLQILLLDAEILWRVIGGNSNRLSLHLSLSNVLHIVLLFQLRNVRLIISVLPYLIYSFSSSTS